MAKLTSGERNALPSSSFAEPGKRAYPIEDAGHAKAALSRVSQFGSPAEKQQVRGKVRKKFPGIGSRLGKRARPAEEKGEGDMDSAAEERSEGER